VRQRDPRAKPRVRGTLP